MKKLIFIFLLIIFIVSCNKPTPTVCIEDKCVNVEVVDEYDEIIEGLMFREHLDEDTGMLFVFQEEGVHHFWMKNTLIPLDMIWIDKDNKIIFIKKNAQPCKQENCASFGPDEKVKYVLEANAGYIKENSIQVGDIVSIGHCLICQNS